MELSFRLILRVIVICLMFCSFIFQMWEQFDKFLKRQKTVAVSFEEKNEQKFPTFAFCDSRGYNKEFGYFATPGTSDVYNETAFDVEREVVFMGVWTDLSYTTPNISQHMVPTMYNGYCKLYEFHEHYTTGAYAGEYKLSVQNKCWFN